MVLFLIYIQIDTEKYMYVYRDWSQGEHGETLEGAILKLKSCFGSIYLNTTALSSTHVTTAEIKHVRHLWWTVFLLWPVAG